MYTECRSSKLLLSANLESSEKMMKLNERKKMDRVGRTAVQFNPICNRQEVETLSLDPP